MKICSKCEIEKDDSEFYSKSAKKYCKECGRKMCKEYKERNKEKIKEYNKEYKEKNKEKIKEKNKEYNIKNKEIIQEKRTIYQKERRYNDINYKLRESISKRIRKLLKSKYSEKSKELIGCTLDEVKKWLEYNFYGNINWENHGSIWHIDHVIPCSLFDLTNSEHRKICFSWANIQPLYCEKNLSKNNNLLLKDLVLHNIKLEYYCKNNNINYTDYKSFLKKLKYTNSILKKVEGVWETKTE